MLNLLFATSLREWSIAEHPWVQSWSMTLVHSLWQACAMGVIFLLGRWLLPTSASGYRYAWASACLGASIVWPCGLYIRSLSQGPEARGGLEGAEEPRFAESTTSDSSWRVTDSRRSIDLATLPPHRATEPLSAQDLASYAAAGATGRLETGLRTLDAAADPPSGGPLTDEIFTHRPPTRDPITDNHVGAIEKPTNSQTEIRTSSATAAGARWSDRFERVAWITRGLHLRRWLPTIFLVWCGGVALFVGRIAFGSLYVYWLRYQSRPLPAQWQPHIGQVRDRFHLPSRSLVAVSDQANGALATGLVRPLVLIPSHWLEELTPEMFRAVVAHEFAHIQRRDLWANLFQHLAETVLFFHPVTWWLSAEIRHEREKCCDRLAASALSDRLAYAQTLQFLAATHWRLRHPIIHTLSLGGKPMRLLDRVQHVLGCHPRHSQFAWRPLAILLGSTAVLATLAAHAPTLAVPVVDSPRLEDPANVTDDSPRPDSPEFEVGENVETDVDMEDEGNTAEEKSIPEHVVYEPQAGGTLDRRVYTREVEGEETADGSKTTDLLHRLLEKLERVEQQLEHQSRRLERLETFYLENRSPDESPIFAAPRQVDPPSLRKSSEPTVTMTQEHWVEQQRKLKKAHELQARARVHREMKERQGAIQRQIAEIHMARANAQREAEIEELSGQLKVMESKVSRAESATKEGVGSDLDVETLAAERNRIQVRLMALEKAREWDAAEHQLQMKLKELEAKMTDTGDAPSP